MSRKYLGYGTTDFKIRLLDKDNKSWIFEIPTGTPPETAAQLPLAHHLILKLHDFGVSRSLNGLLFTNQHLQMDLEPWVFDIVLSRGEETLETVLIKPEKGFNRAFMLGLAANASEPIVFQAKIDKVLLY